MSKYPMEHVCFLPAYHPRSKRTCLSYCTDTASHSDEPFDAVNMHFSDCSVALPMLQNRYIRFVSHLQGVRMHGRRLTSIAARVITEFMVPSWIARDISSTFRRKRATESAISNSEVWKPFWAHSSSSRHAVWSDTWNNAGSPSASGLYHEKWMSASFTKVRFVHCLTTKIPGMDSR